jgi:hypothetical protein
LIKFYKNKCFLTWFINVFKKSYFRPQNLIFWIFCLIFEKKTWQPWFGPILSIEYFAGFWGSVKQQECRHYNPMGRRRSWRWA